MPQKKKTTTDHFTYCNSKSDGCTRIDCARNYANAPWDEIFWMARWTPDKNGKCEGYVDKGSI